MELLTLIRCNHGFEPSASEQPENHFDASSPRMVSLPDVELEKLLDLSSPSRTLADDSLVDYIAARLRSAENLIERINTLPE